MSKEHHEYENYEDWYDNGPGSENFKRKMTQDSVDYSIKKQFQGNQNKFNELKNKIKKHNALVALHESLEGLLQAGVITEEVFNEFDFGDGND